MVKKLKLGLYSETTVLTESERTVMSHADDPLPYQTELVYRAPGREEVGRSL